LYESVNLTVAQASGLHVCGVLQAGRLRYLLKQTLLSRLLKNFRFNAAAVGKPPHFSGNQ